MLMENIMNGNYWFIPLSLLMTVLSCMSYFYFAYKDYEDDSEQIRYVTMSARLIIGCLALVVISMLYAVLPLMLTAAVALPLLAIAVVLMINVEKLPIWEERQMQAFLEKLLMFTFYAFLLVFKLIGWLIKSVVWIVVMLFGIAMEKDDGTVI